MEPIKIFVCEKCGNMVEMIHNSGVPMICCGQKMTEIVPNSTDASQEKHVPVVKVNENKVLVEVGSVPHPMTVEHHIAWIAVLSKEGFQRKQLAVGKEPSAEFMLIPGDKVDEVYAYCNLHGLWKAEL